jgi:hypothetical protein
MPEVNYFDDAPDTNTGAHDSFLEECGVFVSPSRSGAHHDKVPHKPIKAKVRDCEPVRSQSDREHKNADSIAHSALCSRDIESQGEEKSADADWAASARHLIAAFPDAELRSDLTDLFEETAATLEHMQGNARQRAEMLAFGHLMFHLLRSGADCPTAIPSNENPTD